MARVVIETNTYKKVGINDTFKLFLAGGSAGLAAVGIQSIYKPSTTKILQLVPLVPSAAVFFSTYERCKHYIYWINNQEVGDAAVNAHIASVFVAQATTSLFCAPIQTAMSLKSLPNVPKNVSPLQIARNMWMMDRYQGLYSQVWIRLFCDLPAALIFFPVYEVLNRKWYFYREEDNLKDFNPFCGFVFGAISGTISGALTTPLASVTDEILNTKGSLRGLEAQFIEYAITFKDSWTSQRSKLYAQLPTKTLVSSIAGSCLLGSYELFRRYILPDFDSQKQEQNFNIEYGFKDYVK